MSTRQRLAERVQRWDEELVPRAAERVHDLAGRWAAALGRAGRARRQLAELRPADLDARFASRGPLATVRDLPQLGFLVIAAVLLAGTGTVVVRQEPPERRASAGPDGQEDPVDLGTQLGPEVGQQASDYVAAALRQLRQVAREDPTAKVLALVSLTAYRTPAESVQLLTGYDVRRVYLRARAGGPDAAPVPYDVTGELRPALREGYARVAQNREELRQAFLGYVATTDNDKAFQRDYAASAVSAGREVQAYRQGCACVFGAVVEARAVVLLALAGTDGVRAVQPAAKGLTLPRLLVQPLLPETRGLVPRAPLTSKGGGP